MKWLVTGGAGYIGSHVVRALSIGGNEITVLDDESSGKRIRVPDGVGYFKCDIRDIFGLRKIFEANDFEGVVHLAAKKSVSESLMDPSLYRDVNVQGTENLLQVSAHFGIKAFIFSSSAAVYGSPSEAEVIEDTPTVPISPYGDTKLQGEILVARYGNEFGFFHSSLRYFNVGGASSLDLIDDAKANVFPIVLDAIYNKRRPQIFGNDYLTPDGTCIRDYVHVEDIAIAHAKVASKFNVGPISSVMNIGTGSGTSVLELVSKALEVAESDLLPEFMPRREGDSAKLIANSDLARATLEFNPTKGVNEIIESLVAFRNA
jgi:UDP-glucose 4-epimerase